MCGLVCLATAQTQSRADPGGGFKGVLSPDERDGSLYFLTPCSDR